MPTPHISGPSRVAAGDMAILTATLGNGLTVANLGPEKPAESAPFRGLAYVWRLVDSDKQFAERPSPTAPKIEFITSTKGKYTFWFVVSDGHTISAAKHVLTVGDSPSPPSPGPPDPSPVPSPSRFGITEAARQWVTEVPAADSVKAASFATSLQAIADTVLEKKQPRMPQELLDDMVTAANALGPGWATFREKLKDFTERMIAEKRFTSAQDVAAYLKELAQGLDRGS